MLPTAVPSETLPEPTAADLDALVAQLSASWKTRLTVRRQSKDDIGIREIYVSLDGERWAVLHAGQEVTREVSPGPHLLRVHNTLFWKTIAFTLAVGEHARFQVVNRKGFGTYSVLSYLLGANVIYLSVERYAGPA
jgi:hypothetical protein